MSKVHCLKTDAGRTAVAIHYLVPAGNNSADVSWKNAVVASALNVTSMTEGDGAGQITAAEKAQITAGDVVEIIATVGLEATGGSTSQVAPEITRLISEDKARINGALKWWGRAEGVVS